MSAPLFLLPLREKVACGAGRLRGDGGTFPERAVQTPLIRSAVADHLLPQGEKGR